MRRIRISKPVSLLCSLLVVIALISLAIQSVTFNPKTYSNLKNKELVFEVVSYLENTNGLDPNIFNEREISHMRDVKNITLWLRSVMYALLIVIIALSLFIEKKEYIKILKRGAVITLGFGLIIGILVLIKFEWFFLQLHYLLFTNMLWMLNARTDMLVRLFPESFFRILSVKIVFLFLMYSIILYVAAKVIERKKIKQ